MPSISGGWAAITDMIRSLALLPLFLSFLLPLTAGEVPTFTQHVAPILMRNCVPCHRQDGAGPFPLTSFEDVRKRASMVAYVTEDRYMPPQRNDPSYRSFAHERRLTDAEIRTIGAWVEGGMVEGPARAMPPVPPFPDGSMLLGRPTVTLSMRSDVPIPGTNRQTYICYAIPFEFDREQYMRGIDYLPGNRKLSHHASYQILEVAPDVSLHDIPEYFMYRDSQFVDDIHDYRFFGLVSPTYGPPREVFHAGWLPGMSPLIFPDGIGFRLPRRGVLLIRNLHYAPTPVAASDRARINMYAGRKEPRTIVFAAFKPALKSEADDVIRAGSTVTHHIFARIHDDVSALTINPHMHLLGRSFRVWVETPKGDTIPLVDVPDWDFNWQEFYRFKRPIRIPAGSVLNAVATFDNTAGNPHNPFHPPRDIPFEGSMDDSNEMMRLVLLLLPYRKGDENIDLERPLR